jgi:hypothetical protein
MAYTSKNFKTKKALKEAVKRRMDYEAADDITKRVYADSTNGIPPRVTYYQPNSDITGAEAPQNGTVFLEGPHYPEPHKWYAECEVRNGQIIKVK